MEHPNMSQSDQQKMDTFSKMFELDWRGDRSVTNKREFMSLNPVYLNTKDQSNVAGYGVIGEFELLAMLRSACTPFVENLTQNLVETSHDKK